MKTEVEIYEDEARTGSYLLAQGLEREHKIVTNLIRKYQEDFEDFGTLPIKKLTSTGGRAANDYMLNYDQFVLCVALMKNNDQVVKLTGQIIKAGDVIAALKLLKQFDFDKSTTRFVYAAVDGSGRVKIGISNNPERRVKELSIGNADELKLIFTKKATGNGYSDEITLHEKCEEFHIRSEWFKPESVEVLL
jgi:hypothetical protein